MIGANRCASPRPCGLAAGEKRFRLDHCSAGLTEEAYDGNWWEVLQPIMWIGELLDLRSWYSDGFHNLELVCVAGRLGLQLAFGCLAHGGAFRGRGSRRFVFFLAETFEVLSKHFHFADDLVGSGLCSQVRDAYNE